jgi:GTP-binding protein Era
MPKVWYIAIVGRPNAGKSTFLNALIGEKVSAISSRPQTTQRTIPGIFTDEDRGIQLIFLDTPGIHQDANVQYGSQKSDHIHTLINAQAFAGLREADVILRLVDPTRPYGAEDERIDTALSYNTKPVIRVETKQDLDKGYLGKDIDYKIDSINHIGFEELITAIATKLPDGPYLYEADQYTDQTMELRVTEVIREILFEELGEELPYACYVEIGSIENTGTMFKVQAYLNVEAESQKLIVIGKWGKKISEIGTRSRLILERIFGKKVFLGLRVKVDKNWRKNEKVLSKLFPKK